MEEFEIRPGERLPAETRMEMPEVSYEQELIMTPVPFENRVAYLSDFVKPHAKRETIEHIAKALGVSVGRAERMAEESAQYHRSIIMEFLNTNTLLGRLLKKNSNGSSYTINSMSLCRRGI